MRIQYKEIFFRAASITLARPMGTDTHRQQTGGQKKTKRERRAGKRTQKTKTVIGAGIYNISGSDLSEDELKVLEKDSSLPQFVTLTSSKLILAYKNLSEPSISNVIFCPNQGNLFQHLFM